MNTIFTDSDAPATAEHVTRESNLIARNLASLGAQAAGAATADHIRRFWAPLLRRTLLEQADAHRDRFSPIASEAIARLRRDAD
jgi:formate dehydrogenase subunit delta